MNVVLMSRVDQEAMEDFQSTRVETLRCDTTDTNLLEVMEPTAVETSRCDTTDTNLLEVIEPTAVETSRCDTTGTNLLEVMEPAAVETSRCDTTGTNLLEVMEPAAVEMSRCDTTGTNLLEVMEPAGVETSRCDTTDTNLLEVMEPAGVETSRCDTTDTNLLEVMEPAGVETSRYDTTDTNLLEVMEPAGVETSRCDTTDTNLLKVMEPAGVETSRYDTTDTNLLEVMEPAGVETSRCDTTDTNLLEVMEPAGVETSRYDTTNTNLWEVMDDFESAEEETYIYDTTDATVFEVMEDLKVREDLESAGGDQFEVTHETQNQVRPSRIVYEGHFYEKYMANQFIGRFAANNNRAASSARRTSWFENRRYLFDPKTQMAQEDERSLDELEEEKKEAGEALEGEGEIDLNEELFSAEHVEEEESNETMPVSIEQQTTYGNLNNEKINPEKNEFNFDEQLNGHVNKNGQDITVESKTIEQSGSINLTKYPSVPSENSTASLKKQYSNENEELVNEKAKRLLGINDESIKETNRKTNSVGETQSDPSKRGSNAFAEGIHTVKQRITRQLSRSLSFRKKSTTKSKRNDEGDDIIWVQVPKDAEEYPMRHERRGVAIIFNHNEFERLAPRDSTERECRDLETELAALGFEVQVFHDLELANLKSVLENTSQMDHSDADCLLIAVLTVRLFGSLFSKDLPYNEEMLVKPFTGDRCSTLIGKPKIFLVDACRGSTFYQTKTDATDSVLVSHMVPVEADILTVTWFYPWRDENQGSWFVQALCDELKANAKTRDLLTLLTFMSSRVAVLCAAVSCDQVRADEGEMPTVTSTLTRQVYFQGLQ